MAAAAPVQKWGKESWITRAVMADTTFDVRALLKSELRAEVERRGFVVVDGSERVEILDPDIELWLRMERDIPEGALVARTSLRCFPKETRS